MEKSFIREVHRAVLDELNLTLAGSRSQRAIRFLEHIRDNFERIFRDLTKKELAGAMSPGASCRRRSGDKGEVCNGGRQILKVGVFPTAANPLHWGHIQVCLEAINQHDLDFVFLLPQGDIRYKAVDPRELPTKELRHRMAKEALRPFYPLLRYSDAGFSNGKIGQDNVHSIMSFLQTPAEYYYMVGVESAEKGRRSLELLRRYANRYKLRRSLTWLFHLRSRLKLTLEDFKVVHSDVIGVKQFSVPRMAGGHVSSTRYRRGDRWLAPRIIDEYARENFLYGHPETCITKARKYAVDFVSAKKPASLEKCFGMMWRAIEAERHSVRNIAPRISKSEVVVTSPVRMDIASGLGSDLFPISYEMGGSVLNASITLRGGCPIKVVVRAIPECEIRIKSEDLNAQTTVVHKRDFESLSDGPLKLYKAAILESGITRHAPNMSLRHALRRLGGGFEIYGSAKIPIGSGLGGSSILAASLLKALLMFTGRTPSNEDLVRGSVRIEWMTKNYGGWQDAAGALVGGIKWIHAAPRKFTPIIEQMDLSRGFVADLESRIVLFHSGKPRPCKDTLQQAILKYLARDPTGYPAILQGMAIRDKMYEAVRNEDIDRFGTLMGEYFNVWLNRTGKKFLSSPVRDILESVADLILGAKVSGAGVFYILVAKENRTRQLREKLSDISRQSGGSIYDFRFDFRGTTVQMH